MTYRLWHEGAETGPFTLAGIPERHQRGDLAATFWRRAGDSTFRPISELDEELGPAQATPVPTRSAGNEPRASSVFGIFLSGGAGVLAAIGLFASLADQLAIGAGLLSLAVSIFVIGLLCQILAALRLIAHRMQR